MARTRAAALRRAASAALLGLAAGCAVAAAPAEDRGPVEVEISGPVIVEAGRSAEAGVTVLIAEGFHIQANPASDRFLIPTELKLEPSGGIEPGEPAYPPGRPHRLQGATSDLSTYEGSIRIRLPLRAAKDSKQGVRILRGSLRYQACDTRRCFPPATAPVEVAVRVAGPGEADRRR